MVVIHNSMSFVEFQGAFPPKLIYALEQLKKENIPPASTCIVSLTSLDKSVLQGKLRAGKFLIQDLTDLSPEEWDPERIRFSSVFRY